MRPLGLLARMLGLQACLLALRSGTEICNRDGLDPDKKRGLQKKTLSFGTAFIANPVTGVRWVCITTLLCIKCLVSR